MSPKRTYGVRKNGDSGWKQWTRMRTPVTRGTLEASQMRVDAPILQLVERCAVFTYEEWALEDRPGVNDVVEYEARTELHFVADKDPVNL